MGNGGTVLVISYEFFGPFISIEQRVPLGKGQALLADKKRHRALWYLPQRDCFYFVLEETLVDALQQPLKIGIVCFFAGEILTFRCVYCSHPSSLLVTAWPAGDHGVARLFYRHRSILWAPVDGTSRVINVYGAPQL